MDLKNLPTFKALASEIAKLDLSSENEQIEALDAEKKAIQAKIEEAETRSSELIIQIRDYEGPDPAAVADALMADISPTEAATLGPSKEDLIAENKALRAAIGQLHDRSRDKHLQIDEIKRAASTKISEVLRPFVDDISKTQIAAAEELVASFAAISLMHDISRHFTSEESRSRSAVKGVMTSGGILPYRGKIQIPPALLEALAPLNNKGKACRAHLRPEITMW